MKNVRRAAAMLARSLLPILYLAALSACQSARHASLYPISGEYRYVVPARLDDGLATGTIEGTLFSPQKMERLSAFFNLLKKGSFGEVHGVLLVSRGTLVLEEYFPGYRFRGGRADFSASDPHHLASVTKSITSLCVGIALDKGFIRSVDQPFLDFYAGYPVPDRQAKEGITLRHLLTMTAGLSWDETTYPYTDLRNDVVQLYLSPDPLKFIMARKPVAPPGSRWAYSGAYPNLLGDIIRRASGLPLDAFAREYLYKPLGIAAGTWITLGKGFIYASGDAELRPRDMAKIGMLVLNHGAWNGVQVVSRSWLDASMAKAAHVDAGTDYGFMWWLPILGGSAEQSIGPVYMAIGWGGQYIIIVPDQQLVLVLTGGSYDAPLPGTIPIVSYMLTQLFMDGTGPATSAPR